jgi:hypothetical protein
MRCLAPDNALNSLASRFSLLVLTFNMHMHPPRDSSCRRCSSPNAQGAPNSPDGSQTTTQCYSAEKKTLHNSSPLKVEAGELLQLAPHEAVAAALHLPRCHLSSLGVRRDKHRAGIACTAAAAAAAAATLESACRKQVRTIHHCNA